MTVEEMNTQLQMQVNALNASLNSLQQSFDAQTALITQLNQTIQELREQLNKNSKNSSKPPSSDGFKKPAPKSLRKPSGKKVGGQEGHQGTYLSVISDPDEIVKHMPSACEGCPHYKMCKGTACVAEKRHVIDAVVTVNVVEHQLLEIPICMLHGDTRKGSFPNDVKATVQYGENLQALSVALNTVGAVSVKRTHEILSGVFNIPLATGIISNMVKRCADAVSETVNRIKQKVADSSLGHFDETGTRVDKNYGGFMMHQTVNSRTLISVQSVDILAWSSAVCCHCFTVFPCMTAGLLTGVTKIANMQSAVPTYYGN